MPLILAPAPGSVTDAELRDLMYQDLRRACDPNKDPYDRFVSLLNASRIAEGLRQTGDRNIPEALRDPAAVRANLLSLGQMGLAHAAYNINAGRNADIDPSLNYRAAQTLISLMAEEGLQNERTSYAVFGGRAYFEQRMAAAGQSKSEKNIAKNAAAGDVQAVVEKLHDSDEKLRDPASLTPGEAKETGQLMRAASAAPVI